MITARQSFVISFIAHAALLIVLFIAGVFLVRHALKPQPIELDLTASVPAVASRDPGAGSTPGSQPKLKTEPEPEPEPEPKPIDRTVPPFNPKQLFDPTKIPTIPKEPFNPYIPKGDVRGTGDSPTPGPPGPTPGPPSYEALIGEEIKRNWEAPGLGTREPTVPRVQVSVTVARSGKIMDYRVTRSSGNAALDRSALEAVRLSNPLLPFPPEMPGVQETFTFDFVPKE